MICDQGGQWGSWVTVVDPISGASTNEWKPGLCLRQDVPDDQQAVACGAIVDTAIPEMPRTLADPIRLSFATQRTAHAAPALGEHGEEILREAYGIDFLAPQGWSTDSEPSAAAVGRLIRQLREQRARAVFVELDIDDLARISTPQRRFEVYLDQQPSGRLDACGDLLAFLRELRETDAPLRPRPRVAD